MPIVKSGSTIIESAPADLNQFLQTGVIKDNDFAICDPNDHIKQIQFDPSPLATNVALVITASASSSGTLTLPNEANATLASALNLSNPSLQYDAPLTGATVAITTARNVVINPAEDIDALTITLPASPGDGRVVSVMSSQAIATLTITPNEGDFVVGGPSSMTDNSFFSLVYRLADLSWYRIG